MIKAPLPEKESERLATLRAYKILDTPPEPAIDDLTFLAAHICQAPIAYVSLVDEQRLWFKSRIGFDMVEVPRDHTFCGHTLLQTNVLTVPDASADLRFCDHPLVAGDPHVRFYAGVPLRAPNGHNIGLLCVMSPEPRELSEAERLAFAAISRQIVNQFDLRRKIDQVIEAREAAVNAANFRARFLANMSHEIRTPMSGVLGMSSLMLKTPLNPLQSDYANTIRDSASGLLEIINDILDISKIEAGHLRLERIDFDLAALLKATVKTLHFTAEQKGLSLTLAELPTLPAAVKGDPGRLRQVILNIISNALKFTSQGGVTFRILREENTSGSVSLRFEITDTGIGIPKEANARIFDSFSQADPSITRKFGGTGLGLAICKQLVERMGGAIGFTSAVGQGTTFWFTLSFDEGVLLAPIVTPEPPRVRTSSRPGPVQVLVAEDNLINQKVIAGFLSGARYHLTIANNGGEAVEAASTIDYDIIFMDCQMPVLNGFDATAAIRRLPSARARCVPIIALTADSMAGDRESCLSAGMDDYLSKPVSEKGLTAMIDNWLARSDERNTSTVVADASAPSPTPGSVRFDEKKLGALRSIESANGTRFVDDLIETFLRNAPLDLALLRAAVDHRAYPEIHRLSHRLKASCAALGLQSLRDKFAELEIIGRVASGGENAAAIFEAIEREMPVASAQIATCLSAPPRVA